jgi:triosephosphate isomerase (TIM)
MRRPFICANWKMHKTVHDTVFYIKELRGLLKDVRTVDIVVAPPFTSVHAASEAARGTNLEIAAQDLYWEREGAFTGEVSAAMLRDAGAEYVIIGHSERRAFFAETDLTVNRKLAAAITNELGPIVCIGESLDERLSERTLPVLDRQLQQGLDGFTAEQLRDLVLAYEPVWAIGTGHTATPAQAQEVHAHIRGRLRQWFGVETAERCRIIYGGSVKPDNIGAIVSQADVDGALVGGASLDARGFADLVRQSQKGH